MLTMPRPLALVHKTEPPHAALNSVLRVDSIARTDQNPRAKKKNETMQLTFLMVR